MKRVKCISLYAYRGALRDPYLRLHAFYTVITERVLTMADETPYIEIKDGNTTLTRPRHLFGPVLTSPSA